MSTVKYGQRRAKVTPADGVAGVLCRGGDGYFFRTYRADGSFKDYTLLHDDLSITISTDALAAFYEFEDGSGEAVLDHSPSVLGLSHLE